MNNSHPMEVGNIAENADVELNDFIYQDIAPYFFHRAWTENEVIADKKKKAILAVFDALNINERSKGYFHLQTILYIAWLVRDECWNSYERYAYMIALKKRKKEFTIIGEINDCIATAGAGNRDFLNNVFGRNNLIPEKPSWKTFLRTVLAILFYCEDNDKDVRTVLYSLSNSLPNPFNDSHDFLAGYIILHKNNMESTDDEINREINAVLAIMQNYSTGVSLMAYIKHTSTFFSMITFGNIAIPNECYNIRISELPYNNATTKVRITNCFLRNGITFLKDLRYFTVDDVKHFTYLGIKLYSSFMDALDKTIIQYRIYLEEKPVDEKTKPICYSVVETPIVINTLIIDIDKENIIDESVMLEVKVTQILHEFGLSAHLLGFRYVREAIVMTSQNLSLVNNISKNLYPVLAEIFDSTPSRVERAIRNCIELACKRGNTNLFKALFESIIDSGKEKPSNTMFIALIADRLQLLMKVENRAKHN